MSRAAPGGFVHVEVLGHVSHLCATDGPWGSWRSDVLDRFDDGGDGRFEAPIAFGGDRLGRIIVEPGRDRFLSSDAQSRIALIAAQVSIAASHPSGQEPG